MPVYAELCNRKTSPSWYSLEDGNDADVCMNV